MFSTLELKNEITLGEQAPINRIILMFAKFICQELMLKYPRGQYAWAGDLKIANLDSIQKALLEVVFTTMHYDDYIKLEGEGRRSIKVAIAKNLFNAFKNANPLNDTLITKHRGVFNGLTFPLNFFTVTNLSEVLQSEIKKIDWDYLPKANKSTTSEFKGFFKKMLGIDTSPNAIKEQLNGCRPFQEQTIMGLMVDGLMPAYERLAILCEKVLKPNQNTIDEFEEVPNIGDNHGKLERALNDFEVQVQAIVSSYSKKQLFENTLSHELGALLPIEIKLPSPNKRRNDENSWGQDFEAVKIAMDKFNNSPTMGNLNGLLVATQNFKLSLQPLFETIALMDTYKR